VFNKRNATPREGQRDSTSDLKIKVFNKRSAPLPVAPPAMQSELDVWNY
jgi:hypothetical protein